MSFPKHAKYVDSGVDWLGQIPSHWAVKRLRFVADLNPSKSEVSHLAADTEVSFLPMEAIGEDGSLELDRVRKLADVQTGYTFFRDGDVTIAKITPCFENGKGAAMRDLCNGIGFGTTELIVTRPKATQTTSTYLHWLFGSRPFRKAGEAFMHGAGGQKRVPDDFVRDFAIGFPPVQEQRHIVTFLNHETSKIDALVEEQRRLIELLKEKRQAVISQAVTKGLNPNVPMKDSGVEWLGKVPAHWAVRPLKQCITFQEGPGIMAADFRDEGVPLLRISCIQSESVTLEGCNYLDPERVARQWPHFRVEVGDLLISGSASMGVVSEVGEEAAGAVPYTGLIRLQGRKGGMIKDFVKHLVVSDSFLRQVQLLRTGSTIQHFGPTHLSQMVVVLPPKDEQEAIAQFLTSENQRMSSLCAAAEAGMTLLQERRSALISAAVTGKIDVRGLVPQPEAAAA